MKQFIFILTLVLSLSVFADSLKATDFVDQFDVKTTLSESTRWVVFTSEKEISAVVNKVFEDLKINDPQAVNGQYVNDISKMPGFVTRMFALPKMKKYPFKVALDKEGTPTSAWPREKGKATLLVLKNFEIVSKQFSDSAEEIKKFIQDQTKEIK